MNEDFLDIEQLRQAVIEIFDTHEVRPSVEETSELTTYTVKTANATMKIAIGPRWIGYGLDVDESVLGKSISIAEDTDLYALGGKNTRISLQIFNEVLECLKGLLERRIYTGMAGKKVILAIPVDTKRYKVVERGKFISNRSILTKGEVHALPDLHPIG